MRKPLLLAPGEQVRLPRSSPVSPTAASARRPAADLLGAQAEVLGPEGHVLFDDVADDLVVRILEHHADTLARSRRCLVAVSIPSTVTGPHLAEQPVRQPREGGLPRTIRSETATSPGRKGQT